jgi:two-component system chemotaxis response regulator CheB
MKQPCRVLVVDDSALMRKLIPQIIERDGTIRVVGTAMDGTFALAKMNELQPHVVTLDLEMPRMDGLETLRAITRQHRVPVIIVSSHSTDGAAATFKALAIGAFDFVAKPRDIAEHMDEIAAELIGKIKAAAQAGCSRTQRALSVSPSRAAKRSAPSAAAPTRIVAIGISTGGPNSLQYMLSHLPADFPGSLVIVQHMPEGFTEMFARRLNDCCAIEVKEAHSGDRLLAGRALLCPGNRHIRVRRMPMGEVVMLSDEERVKGHRPSVDVLFRSLAQEFGPRGVAVLMTGMGEDGADGMAAVKATGGLTIAQSEDTCVVYGMPKAAVERGHALRIVPLDAMADTLLAQCTGESSKAVSASGFGA